MGEVLARWNSIKVKQRTIALLIGALLIISGLAAWQLQAVNNARAATIVRRAERWRTYRSVATWYLWRALEL